MTRTNVDGKSIKMVLQWLLNKDDLKDEEIAKAIEAPRSTFSLRKDKDDYPTYEELDKIGRHFGISARVLQISFGYRGLEELLVLDDEEMRQYLELGGANHAHYPLVVEHHHPLPPTARKEVPKSRKFTPRKDAPSL